MNGQLDAVLGHLRRLAGQPGEAEVSDSGLLERFLRGRDEAAFAELLRRHGPLVLGVCRRVLTDSADAEDVFQATFLVLARKAASIRKRGSVASWLYGVAYRLARRLRTELARRRVREREAAIVNAAASPDEAWRELWPAVDEELNRLPEKYRVPLLLCYLEGKTHEEAARLLGWPKGSLSTRLLRGRDRLRANLARRGVVLTAAGWTALLTPEGASATVPANLALTTLKAALLSIAGQSPTGLVSTQAVALTEGALRTMSLTRLKIAAAVLLTLAAAGSGAALLADRGIRGDEEPALVQQADQPADGKKAENADKPEDRLEIARQRAKSRLNLKQIGLAMHNYHDVNGSFAPPAIYSKGGKPLLSWRVALLPYLEQDALYRAFKLDEPWDSPHNKKLLAQMPPVYTPVGPAKAKNPGATFYQVFVGKGAGFEAGRKTRIADIVDGTSNTIMVVDAATAVPWTKPEDLPYVEDQQLPKLGGMFPDVFHAAFFDGAVYTMRKKFDEKTMRAAITRGGGEVVDLDVLKMPLVAVPSTPNQRKVDVTDLQRENEQLKAELERARDALTALREELELWAEIPKEETVPQKEDPRIARLLRENAQMANELVHTQGRLLFQAG
jgi:RNA polymerase sigma factor (sigma-70 family)